MTTFDLTITGGGTSASGWLTDSPIVVSGGYGGHPTSTRPKRAALTVYEGRSPFVIDIPMLLYRGFHATSGPESVENDRKALENMATSLGAKESQRPPAVTVTSPNFPLPFPPAITAGGKDDPLWWIEDLSWSEERRKPPQSGGEITWKLVTVKLLEIIDITGPQSKKHPTVSVHRGKPYKLKPGDTLSKIAAALYHDPDRWLEIAKFNGIRSDGELKTLGLTTIYLPTGAAVKDKDDDKNGKDIKRKK